jgi:hypothetical protein
MALPVGLRLRTLIFALPLTFALGLITLSLDERKEGCENLVGEDDREPVSRGAAILAVGRGDGGVTLAVT